MSAHHWMGAAFHIYRTHWMEWWQLVVPSGPMESQVGFHRLAEHTHPFATSSLGHIRATSGIEICGVQFAQHIVVRTLLTSKELDLQCLNAHHVLKRSDKVQLEHRTNMSGGTKRVTVAEQTPIPMFGLHGCLQHPVTTCKAGSSFKRSLMCPLREGQV